MGFCMTLVCEKCGRRAPYFRSTDPSIPEWVETLSQSHCDLPGCDTGDRLAETWLDAEGVARDPGTSALSVSEGVAAQVHQPFREAKNPLPPLQGEGER